MTLLAQIGFLLRKEILLEWRQKYAISGILLYVFSTVFIIYQAIQKVEPEVWNSLFWIIVLFASVNAIMKSFVQESGSRQLYYYTLANPMAVILSKILYNILLLALLSLLAYLGVAFVGSNPVEDLGQFMVALFLGSVGFSITFTFISAIASKASNSATLMAILGFPVIIPILLMVLQLSAKALRLTMDIGIRQEVVILLAIDLILLAMALILFPFLWRD